MKYTEAQVQEFCTEMFRQLTIHDSGKSSINDLKDSDAHNLIMEELGNRLHILKMTGSIQTMKEQSIHMANYLFIWFTKLSDEK